jgi:hypothetical protein
MHPRSSAGNAYAYAQENALMYIDPNGLFQKQNNFVCNPWAAAIAKARRLAGCDNNCNEDNRCRQAMMKQACDVCQFLNDTSLPKVYIVPMNLDGLTEAYCSPGKSNCRIDDVLFNNRFCNNAYSTDEFALTMIHEALHACSAQVAGGKWIEEDIVGSIEKECAQ